MFEGHYGLMCVLSMDRTNFWMQIKSSCSSTEDRKGKKWRQRMKASKSGRMKNITSSYADEVNSESDPLDTLKLHKDGKSGVEHAESITSSSYDTHEVSPKTRIVKSTNLDIPFLQQFNPENYHDSRVAAKELFKLLISPVEVDQFYE